MKPREIRSIDIGEPEEHPGRKVEPIYDPVPRENPVSPPEEPVRKAPEREPVPA